MENQKEDLGPKMSFYLQLKVTRKVQQFTRYHSQEGGKGSYDGKARQGKAERNPYILALTGGSSASCPQCHLASSFRHSLEERPPRAACPYELKIQGNGSGAPGPLSPSLGGGNRAAKQALATPGLETRRLGSELGSQVRWWVPAHEGSGHTPSPLLSSRQANGRGHPTT